MRHRGSRITREPLTCSGLPRKPLAGVGCRTYARDMSDPNSTLEPTENTTDSTTDTDYAAETNRGSTSTTETGTESTSESSSSSDQLGSRGADDDNPASKDPADWVTGDEPMTAAQQSYLDTLAREAGEELPDTLTKAQASIEIDRLQSKTGRG